MSRPGRRVVAISGIAILAAPSSVATKVPNTLRPPSPAAERISRPPTSISPFSMNSILSPCVMRVSSFTLPRVKRPRQTTSQPT